MIPGLSLSSVNMPTYYLAPDDREPSKIVDYELGGIALNDATQGLDVQVWQVRLSPIDVNYIGVYLSSPTHPESLLFAAPGITEVSLAFDQNMNPFVAFVENGIAKYWWFDTVTSQQIFSSLPANSRSPKCCMDDKRFTELESSDIILGYVRDNSLYFRAQRDRYEIEYLLKDNVTTDLILVGMNNKWRLQFMLGVLEDPVVVPLYRATISGRRKTTLGPRRVVGGAYA